MAINLVIGLYCCSSQKALDCGDYLRLMETVANNMVKDSSVILISEFNQIEWFEAHPLLVAMKHDDAHLKYETVVNSNFMTCDSNSFETALHAICMNQLISHEDYLELKKVEEKKFDLWVKTNREHGGLTEFVHSNKKFIFISRPYFNAGIAYLYISGEYGSSFQYVLKFRIDPNSRKWIELF